jgi:hypothetical protein
LSDADAVLKDRAIIACPDAGADSNTVVELGSSRLDAGTDTNTVVQLGPIIPRLDAGANADLRDTRILAHDHFSCSFALEVLRDASRYPGNSDSITERSNEFDDRSPDVHRV